MVKLLYPVKLNLTKHILAVTDQDDTEWPSNAGQSFQNRMGEEFVVVQWINDFPGQEEALRVLTEADSANEQFTRDSENES